MLFFAAACLAGVSSFGEIKNSAMPDPKPVIRVETDTANALIPVLSWDTEGGDRARTNLLRDPVRLRTMNNGQWTDTRDLPTQHEEVGNSGTRYHIAVNPDTDLVWAITTEPNRLTMQIGKHGQGAEKAELVFPFNPRTASTCVLPSGWDQDGHPLLPSIISAPDFGQVLLSCREPVALKARLEGSRAQHTVDLIIEMPLADDRTCTLDFDPVRLPQPTGLKANALWRMGRRGWFNVFQPSATWGDPGHPFSAPAGILANNVISDPVSCLIGLYGDHAFFIPEVAPGISVADMVRRTVDWWLDHRTRPSGEVVAYWDYGDMLDANAGPLIAAWDYVEATGDTKWLERRIERLEFIANFLVKRDIDDDGLVESTHSGNYGMLFDPARTASAYDTINAGFKDAYSNALTYRAWRCLADLERKLRRDDARAQYARHAHRLKARFVEVLFNPATGWIAWWKSEDGELHDLASPMINSLAIEYGLVEPGQAREILTRLWKKIEDAGFTRFDLGVPLTLVPVRKGDYLQPKPGKTAATICGAPEREDGTDTFQKYLNGGCCVSDAVHFMTALYTVGENDKADQILHAMLERQQKGAFPNGGGFQNGVVDAYPNGAEFFTWDGQTCGYEGHLTYSFSFLQALFLRQPDFRARLYRPLLEK